MTDLTPELKAYIEDMSYEQLLSRWRFDPIGSSFFQGESGELATERMKVLRADSSIDHVGASKRIGWDQ